MQIPIGVQLYPVRDEAKKDYVGTLERLAEIGFKGIEFYGGRVLPALELKTCLERLGMVSIGYHVLIKELLENLEQVLEYNLEIGSSYIVCPYYEYKGRSDYEDAALLFSRIGEKCKKAGLQFCYHCHGHEFEQFNGEYGVDILFENADKAFLQAEMDTYYIKYGGLDPAEYLKKYSNRCPLLHLRDIKDDENKSAAEMGKGILDMKSILKSAESTGVRWLIVEEEVSGLAPLVATANSYQYISPF